MPSALFPDNRSHPASIVNHLHHEWRHLTIRASELRAARSWGLPGAPISSLDEVLDRSGFRRDARGTTPTAEGESSFEAGCDEYLLQLVTIAKVDALAGRIVLQRILPALCALARRHSPAWLRRGDLLDELVANSWHVIRNYPVERRPRRVASNLVRDIGFQTIVRPQRRRAATSEIATAPELISDTSEHLSHEPLHELVDLLREARDSGAVSEGDVELICQLINHRRPENLAATLGVTPRTVRNHRDAVVHRLRNVALAAA